jgi:hypothetical protein
MVALLRVVLAVRCLSFTVWTSVDPRVVVTVVQSLDDLWSSNVEPDTEVPAASYSGCSANNDSANTESTGAETVT